MNKQILIAFLLVLVSFVWAGSFVVVKTVTNENIDPINLGFLRFLVATPLMIGILLLRKKGLKIPIKELPWLIVLGLTGVTFLYIFQFVGIKYTTASTSAVLINTNVIFIVVLSVFFLHEQVTKKRIIGILLSFLGVVIVMFSKISPEEFTLTNMFFIGCVLMLMSAFCWALYSLVGKRLLKTYDEFVITTYAFALGTLLYLPFVYTNIFTMIQHTSFNGWLAVLYLALTCSIFGYLGWYYALKHMDASKAAVFLNFIPLFTILMSVILGEQLTWVFFGGAILIIYGVYLAQKY
jgi:drug/metabolite transporter (DMT)-like permease